MDYFFIATFVWFGVACAGKGLGHFGQTQVDRVGQDRRPQQGLVAGRVASLRLRKVSGDARSLVDLHQQFGDFNVRQQ